MISPPSKKAVEFRANDLSWKTAATWHINYITNNEKEDDKGLAAPRLISNSYSNKNPKIKTTTTR